VSHSSTTTTIVTAVLSGGGMSTLGLAIKGILDRRKTSTDAAAVILQAGTAQVTSQAAQLERQSAQLARQDARIEELEKALDQMDARDRVHSRWDWEVSEKLRGAGINVGPPPPLGRD
jgi:hypothetical protein